MCTGLCIIPFAFFGLCTVRDSPLFILTRALLHLRFVWVNMAQYLFLILLLISLPCGTLADGWEDFSNNLVSDLAPLITLFGEQVTKQFLSESLDWLDNLIFALAPLGILTAVISAIRVSGNPTLRAFIGRAQEGPGNVEIELLSSTSETVAELWNEGAIARVFGRPKLLEVVTWTDESSYEDDVKSDEPAYKAEIDLIDRAMREDPPLSLPGEYTAPNLSINKGIKSLHRKWFHGVAGLGLILQAGNTSFIHVYLLTDIFTWVISHITPLQELAGHFHMPSSKIVFI